MGNKEVEPNQVSYVVCCVVGGQWVVLVGSGQWVMDMVMDSERWLMGYRQVLLRAVAFGCCHASLL